MRADKVSGTEGYAEAAVALLESKLPFVDLYRSVLHLIPSRPSAILDIGSGPGHDAAVFAEMDIASSQSCRPGNCGSRQKPCIRRH
jgi:hypothetical protein